MDSKNKNILIGGLLAIVLVMAVGYAAFATQLNINGTATISSSWDVHYKLPSGVTEGTQCTSNTPATPACGITVATGTGAGANPTAPTGTITYETGLLTATLGATLVQPGDTVTYVLTPHNYGTIAAVAGTPIIKIASGNDASSASALQNETHLTVGLIDWAVDFTGKASVGADTDDNAITVTATFVNPSAGATVSTQSASINVAIMYSQA